MKNITFVLLLAVVFFLSQGSAEAREKSTASKKPPVKTAGKTARSSVKTKISKTPSKGLKKNSSKSVAKKVVKSKRKAVPKTPQKKDLKASHKTAGIGVKVVKASPKLNSKGRKPAQVRSSGRQKTAASKKIAKAPVAQKGFHFIPLPPKKNMALRNGQTRTTSSVNRARVVSYFKKDRVAIKPDGDEDASEVTTRLVRIPRQTKVGIRHSVRDE